MAVYSTLNPTPPATCPFRSQVREVKKRSLFTAWFGTHMETSHTKAEVIVTFITGTAIPPTTTLRICPTLPQR